MEALLSDRNDSTHRTTGRGKPASQSTLTMHLWLTLSEEAFDVNGQE